MATIPASPTDRSPATAAPPMLMSDAVAKDTIIAWFRGEFAAANAIIDALCGHLAQIGGTEYDTVFTAIHRRRLNWIPVLQMQKYHSIADVAVELRQVTAKRIESRAEEHYASVAAGKMKIEEVKEKKIVEFEAKVAESNGDGEIVGEDDSPDSDITDSGSQDVQATPQDAELCLNHKDCDTRIAGIKLTKGFSAKEPVKGHMVNVVKGLKLYENIFTGAELSKLTDFVSELQAAGQNGELSGETFILFNKEIKGNKRELIQFGVPIFGQIKEDDANNNHSSNIEPIPALLESVIDHMIQWQLLPVYKRPNCCIISFFDEGEHSQPFLKPPHLEQPISTLLLSESTMAFGRILVSDNDGNYKGPLMLSLKEGSLLVLRGNSADMARHVMCPSPSKRVSITFFRVRLESNQCHSPTTPLPTAMTLWQPTSIPSPYTAIPNGALNGCEAIPKWGVLHAPIVMLAPVHPMVLSPQRLPRGGTGVFLPWTRKPAKHLPPRAQKGRLLTLPSQVESRSAEAPLDSGITV